MMPVGKLAKVVVRNTIRSPRHFVLSAFGIVIGIAAFVFFLGLSLGVRNVVLGKIFPLERVEVRAPRTTLGGVDVSKKLNDEIVETIRERSEVKFALPRMQVQFPASGRGSFEGQELKFEVGGFADGIDPSFLEDESFAHLFQDWESEENKKKQWACSKELIKKKKKKKGGAKGADSDAKDTDADKKAADTDADAEKKDVPEAEKPAAADSEKNPDDDSDKPAGSEKEEDSDQEADGADAKADAAGVKADGADEKEPKAKKKPKEKYKYTCPGGKGVYYCNRHDMTCHHRVPVVLSPTLLELYNGQFAKSHGLPSIHSEIEEWIKERGGLGEMVFRIGLGETLVAGSNINVAEGKQRVVEGVLIGVTDKAMPIGLTIPIQYVKRWNAEFLGEEAASQYSSIVVTLRSKNDVAPFHHWLEEQGLTIDDNLGRRFATAIFIIMALFVLISFVIVTISAINIAHNFFMQISERRREIGVLRAVGATRADVRVIILCESALIGVIGGVLGIGLAMAGGWAVDAASAAWLPAFPFKPESYFDFQGWVLGGGLGFAILFCVLGGFLPARRAAKMEPAQALSAQ
jgi:hypothetical protein